MSELKLEVRNQKDGTGRAGSATGTVLMVTPPLDEDYWAYRVMLSDRQAIVGFPKFLMIGIGFAVEEDWNTNLPSSCDAEEIYDHIAHNKGDDSISREDCITAIRMIQQAVFPEEAARERPGDWQALRDWLGDAVRFKASQTPGDLNDAVKSGLEIALAKMREMEADR